MVLETDAVDKVKVGIDDFLWGVVGKDTDEERNDALDDECVALG